MARLGNKSQPWKKQGHKDLLTYQREDYCQCQ